VSYIAEFQVIITKTGNLKGEYKKNSELISILSQRLAGKMNLARKVLWNIYLRAVQRTTLLSVSLKSEKQKWNFMIYR